MDYSKQRRRRVKALVNRTQKTNREIIRQLKDTPNGWFRPVSNPEEREAFIADAVQEMEVYLRPRYELEAAWTLDVKLDWTKRRNRSWGGVYSATWRSRMNSEELGSGPGINLAMCEFEGKRDFKEYPALRIWGDLGAVSGCNWEEYMLVLLMHEMSHAVQHTIETKDLGHGYVFRKIYSDLRCEWGYVDGSIPLWSELGEAEQTVAAKWKKPPHDPMLALRDPEAYRKERRRLQQRKRREAARNG